MVVLLGCGELESLPCRTTRRVPVKLRVQVADLLPTDALGGHALERRDGRHAIVHGVALGGVGHLRGLLIGLHLADLGVTHRLIDDCLGARLLLGIGDALVSLETLLGAGDLHGVAHDWPGLALQPAQGADFLLDDLAAMLADHGLARRLGDGAVRQHVAMRGRHAAIRLGINLVGKRLIVGRRLFQRGHQLDAAAEPEYLGRHVGGDAIGCGDSARKALGHIARDCRAAQLERTQTLGQNGAAWQRALAHDGQRDLHRLLVDLGLDFIAHLRAGVLPPILALAGELTHQLLLKLLARGRAGPGNGLAVCGEFFLSLACVLGGGEYRLDAGVFLGREDLIVGRQDAIHHPANVIVELDAQLGHAAINER